MIGKELPAVSMPKQDRALIYLLSAHKHDNGCWKSSILEMIWLYNIWNATSKRLWTHCFIFYLARLLQGENKNGSVTFINGGKGLNMFLSNWVQWNSSIWTPSIFLTFPAHFYIPIIFSNSNLNCSNVSDLRNLQKK